ncbi:DUF3679 domain-containing protein [Falsibacillus pallidus]|uniref:DUF3679 domain-containing protein n=1 Tax=Falsibacillus pallidus TaxID=493781 RepID=UPI003D98D16D
MKMFMLKCVLLVSILFIGVLMGMEKANEGMHNLKGQDAGLESPLSLKKDSGGEVEASVLGKDVSSSDIEAKKKQLQEMKTFNFFSSIGKSLAESIRSLMEKLVNAIASLI